MKKKIAIKHDTVLLLRYLIRYIYVIKKRLGQNNKNFYT